MSSYFLIEEPRMLVRVVENVLRGVRGKVLFTFENVLVSSVANSAHQIVEIFA